MTEENLNAKKNRHGSPYQPGGSTKTERIRYSVHEFKPWIQASLSKTGISRAVTHLGASTMTT